MTTATEVRELYQKMTGRKVLLIVLLLVALIALAIGATSVGTSGLGFADAARVIASKVFPFAHIQVDRVDASIIWDTRLPRVIFGILAGASLAIAGSTMQGVLRNPLVSPFTIGISSGAAFGAALAIAFGMGLAGGGSYIVILNAFIFALLTMALVYGIARIRSMSPETIILAGIAVSYLFMGLVAALQYIAGAEALQQIVFWTFGSLDAVRWEKVLIVLPVLVICIPLMVKYAWDLNVMGAGEEVASSLGVDVKRVRVNCLLLSTIVTATVIAFTGIIGFIGLVAPHIARLIIGGDHRYLLPCSCLMGALLLLAADTLGRAAFPVVIPVGIMTSFIGVPFFVYLLTRKRREFWQ
jgi:iron complex transport system permease protein